MDGTGDALRLTLAQFRSVRARIQPWVRLTPVVPSELQNVFLKLETLQHTHSFKLRGAFSYMTDFVRTEDRRNVLTVSAGNHGLGIARAASVFNLPCTIVVPANAPKTKIDGIRQYGVNLRIEGANYDEAEAWTLEAAKDVSSYAFVSPYNDPSVVLGQGTLAFEILEQVPQTNTIVVPIGGGGLAAGVACAAKQLRPSVRVIGVQTEASAAVYHSLKAGHMLRVPDLPSIADGIAGNIDLETMTFPLIQKYVDDVVLVSEDEIRSSMEHLLRREKLVAEGAAAAGFAAALYRKVDLKNTIVVVLTGANIDLP